MLIGLAALKAVSTMVVVLGLSAIAERAGPRVAGMLAGLPLGTAIVFFFLGVEQGPEFVTDAAVYTLAALASTLAFSYAYWFASSRIRRFNLVLTSLAATLVFAACTALLSLLTLDIVSASAVVLAAIALSIAAMHAIPEQRMVRVRMTLPVMALRAGTAAAVVLAVTGLAETIGPRWSGLLSGFPMTFYPLLLVIHASHSTAAVHGILRNFPFGVGAVVTFTFCAYFLFEPLGVVWGTLAAMAAGFGYLLAFFLLNRLRIRLLRRWRRPPETR